LLRGAGAGDPAVVGWGFDEVSEVHTGPSQELFDCGEV
jgi:hypothetical protein